MFAPRQEVAARELTRVARPGATIAVAAWTPEGVVGRIFRDGRGAYMPPPPPELRPPVMWGEEDHVRLAVRGHRRRAVVRAPHVVTFARRLARRAWVEQDETMLGPAVMAKAALEPQGRYDELRTELIGLYRDVNEADDGSFRAEAEYLLTIARMPA